MTPLTFTVYGVAIPKGSARAFVPKGWTRAVVTAANPRTKGWQQLVAEGASRALQAAGGQQLQGAVRLEMVFFLPRPASLPKRMQHHTTRPDADKLARTVGDALTGVAWRDDSQVVTLVVTKRYVAAGEAPHARITVQPEPVETTA